MQHVLAMQHSVAVQPLLMQSPLEIQLAQLQFHLIWVLPKSL